MSDDAPPEPDAAALADDGRILEGHQYVLLTEASGWSRVARGRVALYAVTVEEGAPQGARHYLLTLHEGALMIGGTIELEDRRIGLLASPIGGTCRIEPVSPIQLMVAGSEGYDRLWTAVANYADAIGRRLAKMTPYGDYCERPGPAGAFEYDAGMTFQPAAKEAGWMELDAGEVAMFDKDLLLANTETPLLAVTPGLWFRSRSPVRGRFVTLEGLRAEGRMGPEQLGGVLQLSRVLLIRSLEEMLAQEAAEVRRLRRLNRQRAVEERSVVRSLTLDLGQLDGIEERETALLTALGAVGKAIDVEFREPESFSAQLSRHDQVAAITRASGTRLRRVKLVGDWWNDDVGTLLAFREQDGTPVALICNYRHLGFRRFYEVVDPSTGTRAEITEEFAEGLAEDAYTFITPLPDFSDGVDTLKMARFAVGPYFTDIRLVFLLSLAGALLGLIGPIANKMMLDQVIPDANRRLILDLAFGMTAVSIGMFVFSLGQGLITLRVQTSLTYRLQSAIVDRLLRLPSKFFRSMSSGDLLNRSMMISEISTAISSTVAKSLLSALNILLMLGLCFYYSQKLAWLALGTAVVTGGTSMAFSFAVRKISLVKEVESGKLFGFVVQMVHGVSKLQVAGAEDRAFGKWAEKYGELLRMEYRMDRLSQTSGVINGFLKMASTAFLFYLAGRMVQATVAMQAVSPLTPPLLTIGTFFAFQSAFDQAVGGIVGFFHTFVNVHQLMAKRELVVPILEAPLEGAVERADPGLLEGNLSVRDALFRYSEDGPVILDHVSVEAYPGEFIALVGPSGSGKSTLLKLLLGFEHAERGAVLYDGRDLTGLDLNAVRSQVGVVLQDGRLNAGTIYQLISGARPLTLDQAWAAAEEAGFAEDIKDMPMGMHTLLPEGASTLSGGQRQRLMIARALALDPRVVFFDEATSALDNRTQQIVGESLARRKVTRVVVAHRLSTVKDAHRIYVLERGRIVESGNYKQLMQEEGLFYRLAIRQLTEDDEVL
jgi:ATP-binding cassette subfamily C protein